jgi:hypothetical protein
MQEASQQQGLQGHKYAPAPAAISSCVPACADLNGACSADCMSITCDSGWSDCNNNLTDGCETSLEQPTTCGACDNDCTECNGNATCSAGKCRGDAMPNGSACRPVRICQGRGLGGTCMAGQCMCADQVDMAGLVQPFAPPPDMAHGLDLPGDCSFTGGGTATASMMLVIGALVLLNRRRRPR